MDISNSTDGSSAPPLSKGALDLCLLLPRSISLVAYEQNCYDLEGSQ